MSPAARSSRARRPAGRYAVRVANEQSRVRIDAARLRRTARAALRAEQVTSASVSVAIVDNATIRGLNRRHLDHDYATDVLSFPFEIEPASLAAASAIAGPRGRGRRIDGEIVLSAEMAVQAARRFGWSAQDEIALYLVHGLLHLCGYDDLTGGERRTMRRRESAVLDSLGIRLPGSGSD